MANLNNIQEDTKLIPRNIVDNHILLGFLKGYREFNPLSSIDYLIGIDNYKKMHYQSNSYSLALRKCLMGIKVGRAERTFNNFMSGLDNHYSFAIHVKGEVVQLAIYKGMLLDVTNDKLLMALTHFVEENGNIPLKRNGKSYKIWINKDLYDDKFLIYKSVRRNVNKAKDEIRDNIRYSRIINLKDNYKMAELIKPIKLNYSKHNIIDIISYLGDDIKNINSISSDNYKILEKCKHLVL